jgi:hypothetical protein
VPFLDKEIVLRLLKHIHNLQCTLSTVKLTFLPLASAETNDVGSYQFSTMG